MRSRLLLSLALASGVLLAACQSTPEAQPAAPVEEPAAAPAASPAPSATQISWPAVTQVLDGTDLTDIQKLKLVEFSAAAAAGTYESEQGGSILSLDVKADGSVLQAGRQLQEPGEDPHTKQYSFSTVTAEGATTANQDAFLRQTREGVILLEQNSGIDTIPATYWVHYIRKK